MCNVCVNKLTGPLNSIYFTFHLELVLLFWSFHPVQIYACFYAFKPTTNATENWNITSCRLKCLVFIFSLYYFSLSQYNFPKLCYCILQANSVYGAVHGLEVHLIVVGSWLCISFCSGKLWDSSSYPVPKIWGIGCVSTDGWPQLYKAIKEIKESGQHMFRV